MAQLHCVLAWGQLNYELCTQIESLQQEHQLGPGAACQWLGWKEFKIDMLALPSSLELGGAQM